MRVRPEHCAVKRGACAGSAVEESTTISDERKDRFVDAALVIAAEAANTIPGQPWMYGAFALGALLTALFLVSRLNSKR